MKTIAARVRGKLWIQGTEENYGCKGPMKIMAARNKNDYGCKGR
jgi:hypothetical protein